LTRVSNFVIRVFTTTVPLKLVSKRGHGVPTTHFFRVDGADQETGEETYVVIEADTKPHAERLARETGLLISSVRVARQSDWEQAPTASVTDSESATQLEDPGPVQTDADPSGTPEPEERFDPDAMSDAAPPHQTEDRHAPHEVSPGAAPEPRGGAATAAAVLLTCVGTALVVGGVLALTLALWPNAATRTQLQQIDFRLHELSQTILGGVLVLAGLMAFILATLCYLFRGATARD
jgi:hypothetical protein